MGAMICEGQLDAMFFFIDPMSPMPHDVDVKALSRLAIVYDLPFAHSPSTADFVLNGMVKERPTQCGSLHLQRLSYSSDRYERQRRVSIPPQTE